MWWQLVAHVTGSGLTVVLALLTFFGWLAAIPIAHAVNSRRSPDRFGGSDG